MYIFHFNDILTNKQYSKHRYSLRIYSPNRLGSFSPFIFQMKMASSSADAKYCPDGDQRTTITDF